MLFFIIIKLSVCLFAIIKKVLSLKSEAYSNGKFSRNLRRMSGVLLIIIFVMKGKVI